MRYVRYRISKRKMPKSIIKTIYTRHNKKLDGIYIDMTMDSFVSSFTTGSTTPPLLVAVVITLSINIL